MNPTVHAEARLRGRNQLTLPDSIVRAAGANAGDTFVVELSSSEPDTLLLRRVRTSYAGAVRGLYGDDPSQHLEQERNSWG